VLKDEDEAKIASNLLGLNSSDVIHALTHKNTVSDTITTIYNLRQ